MKKLFISLGLMLLSLSVSAQIYTKNLEKSALKGDEKSIFDLGICYLNGSGIGVDNEKAFDCFFKLLKNNKEASYYIAQMFEKGLVSEPQVNLLMSDIKSLEERFTEEAPNTMSYLKSDSISQSVRYAYDFYYASAKKNNVDAKIKVADLCWEEVLLKKWEEAIKKKNLTNKGSDADDMKDFMLAFNLYNESQSSEEGQKKFLKMVSFIQLMQNRQ